MRLFKICVQCDYISQPQPLQLAGVKLKVILRGDRGLYMTLEAHLLVIVG
jgi:hypothetical protein